MLEHRGLIKVCFESLIFQSFFWNLGPLCLFPPQASCLRPLKTQHTLPVLGPRPRWRQQMFPGFLWCGELGKSLSSSCAWAGILVSQNPWVPLVLTSFSFMAALVMQTSSFLWTWGLERAVEAPTQYLFLFLGLNRFFFPGEARMMGWTETWVFWGWSWSNCVGLTRCGSHCFPLMLGASHTLVRPSQPWLWFTPFYGWWSEAREGRQVIWNHAAGKRQSVCKFGPPCSESRVRSKTSYELPVVFVVLKSSRTLCCSEWSPNSQGARQGPGWVGATSVSASHWLAPAIWTSFVLPPAPRTCSSLCSALFLWMLLTHPSGPGLESSWSGPCVCSVTQSCLTLWTPMDCSLPGSSVHGIFQARVLEWVAISFYRY